jgi:Tol biopolymer transport system component
MRILPLLLVLLAAGGATPSPAAEPSGQIAFWSDRDSDPDVFTMNVDGSNPRNLGRPGWGTNAHPGPRMAAGARTAARSCSRTGRSAASATCSS